MKKKTAGLGPAIVLTLLSIAAAVGTVTIFKACGAKDDGSFMSCHWAEIAAFAMAVILSVNSIMLAVIRNRAIGIGIKAAMIPATAAMIMIPGVLIGTCSMRDMRCVSCLTPWVRVMGILLILVEIVSLSCDLWRLKKDEK